MQLNPYNVKDLDDIVNQHPTNQLLYVIEEYIEENLELAKAMLRKVIEHKEKPVKAYLLLGHIFYSLENNPEKAEGLYKKALETEPIAECYSALGMINHDKGNKTQAEEFYIKALNIKKQPKEMYDLACLYIDNNRHNEGIILLKGAKSKIKNRLKKKLNIHSREFYTLICITLIDAYRQKGDFKSSFQEQAELDNSHYKLIPNIDQK